MNSNYYIPTAPGFKNIIQSIWQVNEQMAFEKEYIIPKGVVEIIFNFSGSTPVTALLGSNHYDLPNCFINGFNSMPIEIQLPKQQSFFGICFQPLAIKKIFKHPAALFADTTVDLTLIDKKFQSLWYQLAAQNDFDKRIHIILSWASRHIIEWQAQEQLLSHFLYNNDLHDLSVKDLSHKLCYSPRHVARKIAEATGMNTENFLLYKKYLHALQLLHGSTLSLTSIAYQSGFADQSHFIKSFRAYTNMTPGAYQRNKSLVKGHVYQDVR